VSGIEPTWNLSTGTSQAPKWRDLGFLVFLGSYV